MHVLRLYMKYTHVKRVVYYSNVYGKLKFFVIEFLCYLKGLTLEINESKGWFKLNDIMWLLSRCSRIWIDWNIVFTLTISALIAVLFDLLSWTILPLCGSWLTDSCLFNRLFIINYFNIQLKEVNMLWVHLP